MGFNSAFKGLIAVRPLQLLAQSYLQYLAIVSMLYSHASFSRAQTSYNLVVREQDCTLDEATLSTLLLWWPLWSPTLCAAELRLRTI